MMMLENLRVTYITGIGCIPHGQTNERQTPIRCHEEERRTAAAVESCVRAADRHLVRNRKARIERDCARGGNLN